MRKLIFVFALAPFSLASLKAQEIKVDSAVSKSVKKDWSKVTLGDRANDHFMIQLGYDGWANMPDTISTSGFGKHLNIYFMLDKPFKTDPRWSVGLGAGIGSSNISFKDTHIDLKGSINRNQVTFRDVSEMERFKKYKLTTVWAEAPIELRFVANPLNSNASWKIAVGAKIGTMISGHTKGKDLQNAEGQSLYGNKYTQKEKDRKFMDGTRLAGTIRLGYGNITLYGAYQITPLFKEGQGPEVRPFSIGLAISGL